MNKYAKWSWLNEIQKAKAQSSSAVCQYLAAAEAWARRQLYFPASLQGSGVGSIISQYKIKEKGNQIFP